MVFQWRIHHSQRSGERRRTLRPQLVRLATLLSDSSTTMKSTVLTMLSRTETTPIRRPRSSTSHQASWREGGMLLTNYLLMLELTHRPCRLSSLTSLQISRQICRGIRWLCLSSMARRDCELYILPRTGQIQSKAHHPRALQSRCQPQGRPKRGRGKRSRRQSSSQKSLLHLLPLLHMSIPARWKARNPHVVCVTTAGLTSHPKTPR